MQYLVYECCHVLQSTDATAGVRVVCSGQAVVHSPRFKATSLYCICMKNVALVLLSKCKVAESVALLAKLRVHFLDHHSTVSSV
jgi:hypothetical protein